MHTRPYKSQRDGGRLRTVLLCSDADETLCLWCHMIFVVVPSTSVVIESQNGIRSICSYAHRCNFSRRDTQRPRPTKMTL